jgi:hypothetical protein
MRWTAFDQETAAALAQHVPNVELSRTAADELESALDAAATTPAVLVTPAADGEHTLLATFRTRDGENTEATTAPVEPAAYQAGGFLGLADEPVFDDEK